jgi:hypothetical protein
LTALQVSALTLVVPGILDASRDEQSASSGESAAVRRLIADAPSAIADDDAGYWDLIGAELRIPRENDVPTASIWARAEAVDVGTAFWFNAAPVTMEIGRTDIRLKDATPALDARESTALLATLNEHFAADSLKFVGPRPGQWFVRATPSPAVRTRAPEFARARGVRDSLAAGADSARWRRWQNEIQMLLFDHAINQAREARGLTPVNSVWFWGGGSLPEATTSIDLVLLSDDAATSQLGEFAGARVLPLAQVDAAFASASTRVLVVLPRLRDAADTDAAIVATIDRTFTAHIYDRLSVILVGDDRHVRVECKRRSLWRRFVRSAEPPTYEALFARWGIERNGP